MGESHNIVNIARRYALLAGVNDPEIICTWSQGRREKLDEETDRGLENFVYPTRASRCHGL